MENLSGDSFQKQSVMAGKTTSSLVEAPRGGHISKLFWNFLEQGLYRK
jgi:hypothetical protein